MMNKEYKEYIVKARRASNGGIVLDCFTAYSEGDARHCFRECYRHDNYTISEVADRDDKIFKTLTDFKNKWENELSAIYGGELEIDYLDGQYYACAFHNEPKDGCDSWLERINEFDCLGNNVTAEYACRKLGIPVCR